MIVSYVLYAITCETNGKLYVGYTSKTAEERFTLHLLNARWKRKTALYDAMRCYGSEAFSVRVLLTCASHAEACEHERRLIAEFGSILPNGYNMTVGGDGVPLTSEQREKANAKKRGRCTDKQRAAAARRRGSRASEETKAKLSAARRGKSQSEDHVRKRVETFRRNRAIKLGVPYVEAPVRRSGEPRKSKKRGGGPRVWTPAARMAERERALRQWTPEARAAAKQRAAKQWTAEARQAARERALARRAKERKSA